MQYGVDWQIAISINQPITTVTSFTLPDTFTSSDYSKSQVTEFLLTARSDIQFHVDIIINNKAFLNSRYLFLNSTSVDIVSPYRAMYPKPVSFFVKLTQNDRVTLPINLPVPDYNNVFPEYWIDTGSLRREEDEITRHPTVDGTNFFYPKSASTLR